MTILVRHDTQATEAPSSEGIGQEVLGVAPSDRTPYSFCRPECLIPSHALADRGGVSGADGFGVRTRDANREGGVVRHGQVFGACATRSALDGRLNRCATACGGTSGTTTVTTEERSGDFGSGRGGGGEVAVSYRRQATELATRLQMDGFQDMVTTCPKVGP